MPELPEVESIRRTLLPHLVGTRLTRVTLRRPDICESWTLRKGLFVSTPTTPSTLLQGGVIADILRHGKQLALVARDGRALCITLGMSGHLGWQVTPPDRPHVHCLWKTRDGYLVFEDPRRFGGLWTYPSLDALRQHRWAALGLDALSAKPGTLAHQLAGSARPVKAALLDQSVLAGIGNIYADEALHRARIAPTRPCGSLASTEVRTLAAAIRWVIRHSIAHGGSTLRDYRNADGGKGNYQSRHAVYGRGGQPCHTCGQHLHAAQIAQRTTVWCTSCQPNTPLPIAPSP